jgi:hypothetical protein
MIMSQTLRDRHLSVGFQRSAQGACDHQPRIVPGLALQHPAPGIPAQSSDEIAIDLVQMEVSRELAADGSPSKRAKP